MDRKGFDVFGELGGLLVIFVMERTTVAMIPIPAEAKDQPKLPNMSRIAFPKFFKSSGLAMVGMLLRFWTTANKPVSVPSNPK